MRCGCLRRQIAELADNSAEDVERKTLMLQNAEQQTQRLAYAANFLLAACWEATSETDRDERLKQALVHVEYNFKDLPVEQLEAEGKQRLQKAGCPKPFHWPLEFPEVFMQRGGFDAIVGNPPFMGGSRLRGSLETAYRDYLVSAVVKGQKGTAIYVPISFSVRLLYYVTEVNAASLQQIPSHKVILVTFASISSSRWVARSLVQSEVESGRALRVLKSLTSGFAGTSGRGHSFWTINLYPASTPISQQRSKSVEPHTALERTLASPFTGTKVYGEGFVIEAIQAQSLIESESTTQKCFSLS